MKTQYPDYSFTSHYLSLAGGKIHYIDEGQGPVIVMVHGNPTWSYYFRKLVKHFSSTHRVIVLDHMGCGLSDKPEKYSYTLQQHVENLDTLLDSLKIERFSMVVHDWGGAIGFGSAVKKPEKIDRLVVLNSAAFRSSRIPFRISLCRMPFLGEILVRLFNGFAWPAKFMAVEKRLDQDVAAAFLSPYDSWANRVAVYNFVKDIPMHENHRSYKSLVDIENNLKGLCDLKIPLLLIWGGKDFCFNRSFFDEWVRRFPHAETHYIEDGGHYILEDKIEEIKPIMGDFFSRDEKAGA